MIKRWLLSALIALLPAIAGAAQNSFTQPATGNPTLAHIGVTNPPAPVLSGAGNTGGANSYTYALVAYGHDPNGNLLPTMIGASVTTTTAQSPSAGTPIVVTTQQNPGSAGYDFLKYQNGQWQSICLQVPVFSFYADGASCQDIGQTPLPYTLPQANNTIDLVAPYASIANLNVAQNNLPANQLPAQNGNYNAQGYRFTSLGCPALAGDALVEGCSIGAVTPGLVNSASGALNGSIGQTTPLNGTFTNLSATQSANITGVTTIAGTGSSTMNGVAIGTVTPAVITAATLKIPATGGVGCVQGDATGILSITTNPCGTGTGGGGGGTPATPVGVLQTNGGGTPAAFGAYAGSGPLTTHNFANQITGAGTLLGAQPAFSDISGTCQVSQGCTGATAAGAAAANNIGAFASSNNLSEGNAASMRTNLGLGAVATQPLPVEGNPGNFVSLQQTINHAAPTSSATLTCTSNSGGAYPSWDWFQGKLSGSNVTYTLPASASNCVANDGIALAIVQDASHTVTFTAGAGTAISNAVCPALPTGANSIGEWYFTYNPSTSTPSWVEHCGIPGGSTPFPLVLAQTVGNPTAAAMGNNTPVTVYSFTVPGGTLGTTHTLDLIIHAAYINPTSADVLTVAISYGGTNIASGNTGNVALNALEHVITIYCHLASAGVTGTQNGFCTSVVGTAQTQGAFASKFQDVIGQNNAISVDSTVSQALTFSLTDTQTANGTWKLYSAYVEEQ